MSDWTTTSLDEATSVLRRGTAPVYVDNSDVHAIGQRCVRNEGFDRDATRAHDGRIPAQVVPESGDVLINSTGTGTIGRSCVFRGEAGHYMVDGHVTLARPRPDIADGIVINELVRSGEGQRYLESHCYTGSTNQIELSRTELARMKMRLPPLAEQRRIAEVLDTIDDTIRATERIIEKLGLMRDGIRRSRFGELWGGETVPAGELFEMILGKMLSPASKTGSGSAPYLANRNVQWERCRLDDLDSMDFTSAERVKYRLYPGDLLVCEGGDVGRTALWRGEREDCFFQKAIHRLRSRGTVDPEYMMHFMRYSSERDLFRLFTSQSSIAHLTGEQLAKFPVPTPTWSVQRSVVAELAAFTDRIEADTASWKKLRTLRSGMASDLLSGRVRTGAG